MRVLRLLALLSFVAGVALLLVGFVRSNTSKSEAPPTAVNLVATPTPRPATPTPAPAEASATPTASPTPTPVPDDGPVVRMKIAKLKVDAAIETIGLVGDNQLDVPHNPYNIGWYDIYDGPGLTNPDNRGWYDFDVYQAPGFKGNSVFAGHKDYFPDVVGPFNKLITLQLGDEIDLTMEDGAVYRYRVIKVQRYDAATIPMGDLIWPKDKPDDVEWITLISCGGRFQPLNSSGIGEYLDRDVVVAERIG